MTDIDFLSPDAQEVILSTHAKVLSDATGESGVVDGNAITANSPADMDLNVDSGRIKVLGVGLDVDAGTPTITEADPAAPRIDLVTRDNVGAVAILAGSPAEIIDPKGLGNWHQYTSPKPTDTIPAGSVILGAVYVAAGATSIGTSDIWMFAGRVDDHLVTTIGSPGEDYNFVSEKAIRSALDLKIATSAIVTTVGSPGSDANVPSEQAVREEIAALIPSSSIVTTIASPGVDTKVPSEQAVREELDLRPLLSLLTTRGDMIRRSAATWERFAAGAQNTILAMGASDPAWSTVSALLDTVLGSTQGMFLKRGAATWAGAALLTTRFWDAPAGSWQLPDADAPDLTWDVGTNGSSKVYKFDDTTEEFIEADLVVPDDLYTSGTVTIEVRGYALTAASSKYVQWKLYHSAKALGEKWDAAYASKSSGDKACDATQDEKDVHTFTETVSNLGWVAGDEVRLKLSRIAPSGTNLTGDYCVTHVRIKIPTVIS